MPQVIINSTHLTFSEDTIFITQDMVKPHQNKVTHITFPEGVTTIERYAFQDCTSLTHLTLPDNLTNIEEGTFTGCTGLTSVSFPNGLTTIKANTFNGCTGLTSVSFPDDLTTIGYGAFQGCTRLTQLTFPDSLTTISYSAFKHCTELTSVIFPAAARLTTIDRHAFQDCTSLTQLTFPNSLTTIGYRAFEGCSRLTQLTLPDSLTTIDDHAFKGCTGLISVSFPDGLTTISYSAFFDCTGLTSVTFPDGLTTIDNHAFEGCTGLTHVTFPDSLISIREGAFRRCSQLQYILIPQSLEHYDVAYWQDKGINPARTRIITTVQLPQLPQFQAFIEAKKIDNQTNISEIATLFLADQGHLQLPQARDHLNIRQRITKLSLSNLFSLPIQKNLILTGLKKHQKIMKKQYIIQEALAPLGHWAVQAANPLASWLSWQDIARLWLTKAKAPRKICPPALQAAQIWSHQETPNRHQRGYPKDGAASNALLFKRRPRSQHPNPSGQRNHCTKTNHRGNLPEMRNKTT